MLIPTNLLYLILTDNKNLLLTKQQERFERNRVGLSLLDEPQLKAAILRDQDDLRAMTTASRQYERELWAMLREFDVRRRSSNRLVPSTSIDTGLSFGLLGQLPPALAAELTHIL